MDGRSEAPEWKGESMLHSEPDELPVEEPTLEAHVYLTTERSQPHQDWRNGLPVLFKDIKAKKQ